MDQADARERIRRLRAEIARHDHLYYREHRSEIGDAEYDALVRELADLEARHPDLADEASPTRTPGSDADARFESLPHSRPMISLQNSYELDDVAAFAERIRRELPERDMTYTVEPKIDGVALAVRYRDGVLEAALTRGDGTKGDEVTANVRTFAEVPTTLPDGWRDALPGGATAVEVRGEAYFTLSRFRALNAEREEAGEEPLANPRNAMAGTLKTLDSGVVAARAPSVFFYQLFPLEGDLELATHRDELAAIEALGLPVNPFLRTASDMDGLRAHLDELGSLRDALDYQIDGAVLKVDDLSLHDRLGSTAKAPRWGLAYKYAAEEARTVLESVTLQVGRTGVITPVAELRPVRLAGTTVSRATLHNWDEIERKDVRVGDTVVVVKGGDIIPKVLRAVDELRPAGAERPPIPETCPVCEGPVGREEGEVAVRCRNPLCPAQVAGRLKHFVGREAADIEGLGVRGIAQLLEAGLIDGLPDLFRLRADALAPLPGWGETSAASLVEAAERAKDRDWPAKIFALGIRMVGVTTARSLAARYRNIDELAAVDAETMVADGVEGVGVDVAEAVAGFFRDPRGRALVEELRAVGFLRSEEHAPEREEAPEGTWFEGRKVVLTGAFETWSRSDAKKLVEARGGKVTGSVSGKTDAVIVGADPGSKLDKARDLGVLVLDEAAFARLLEGGSPDDVD